MQVIYYKVILRRAGVGVPFGVAHNSGDDSTNPIDGRTILLGRIVA